MTASPQYVPPAVEPPTHGPATRAAAAVETAIARGYGGRVTDDEMAGPAPTHFPCCTAHGVDMTCAQYRRTHFVEVRPCCAADARLLDTTKDGA